MPPLLHLGYHPTSSAPPLALVIADGNRLSVQNSNIFLSLVHAQSVADSIAEKSRQNKC